MKSALRAFGFLSVSILALMLFDLLLVRDLAWTLDNYQGKRFWVNFGISAFVFWALLFNVRGY